MNCEIKTNIKLSSNIIATNEPIGLYIPFDLKIKDEQDLRIEQNLTIKQKNQRDMSLFFAKEIRESDEIYSKTHQNECRGCPYIDICR